MHIGEINLNFEKKNQQTDFKVYTEAKDPEWPHNTGKQQSSWKTDTTRLQDSWGSSTDWKCTDWWEDKQIYGKEESQKHSQMNFD